ncbi:MAG: efflux RND transporter periplasmic adaptor subunit [Myxococcota bacterium]
MTDLPPPPASSSGKGILIALVLVGALGAVFAVRIDKAKKVRAEQSIPQAAPIPTVAVAPPERREIVDRVSITGTMRSTSEVDVTARMGGRLESVKVKVGDRVRTGQVLAVVEHREVEWQVRQTAAQVQVAEAAVEQARVNAETAQRQLDRMKSLAVEGALPAAELERVEMGLKAAQAGVRTAEAQAELARAAAGLTQVALDNSRITSPIDGIVVARNVQLGSMAVPGAPLFKVQEVAEMKLEGSVTAAEYHLLSVGQQARIVVDELPDQVFEGKVSVRAPSLDAQTRRAAVEILVANPHGRLLPNMFARGSIEIGRREGVLSVAQDAVITDAQGAVVYVVRDGKAEAVRAQVEPTEGPYVAVRSGLTDRDMVVVTGQTGLSPGAPVKIADRAE